MDTHINLPLTNESFGLPLLNDENIETVASPETINTNGLIVLPTVSAHSSSPTTPKEDDLASAWQESMCASLNIPNGYRNVAVLLIRWDDYLDELKCANQVNELKTVFEEQYNFDTELLKLHDKSKGQHQLNGGISAFLAKYDNPHNLVIVYYNGHGIFHEARGHLEIAASSESKDTDYARASWNLAERSLMTEEEIECDVLGILDCCFASDMLNPKRKRSEKDFNAYLERPMRLDSRPDPPIYELLTASGPGLPTSSTPKHSFTGRLIKALNDFAKLEQSFSTHNLNQQIVSDSSEETISCLFNRDHRSHLNGRHIALGRLDRSTKRQNSFTENPIKAYLTLQFALKTDTPNKAQVQNLAKQITYACKEDAAVGVRRIDWVDLRTPARPSGIRNTTMVINSAKRWRRNTVNRRRSGGSSATPTPGSTPNPALLRIEIPQTPKPAVSEHSSEITITPSRAFVVLGFAFEILGIIAFLIVISAFLLYGSGLELYSDFS